MDRHFAALQKTLKADPALKHGPPGHRQLRSGDRHAGRAQEARARASTPTSTRWTFLTGDRDDVDQFAARFGVSVGRALNDARDITHNLRTAIIDADGKLVKVYTGNEWTPEQVLADLKTRLQGS